MRRFAVILLVGALLAAVVVGTTGCASGNDANAAISAGSGFLSEYNKLDQPTADLINQIDAVQPSADQVKQGLSYVDQLDKMIQQRQDLAKRARDEFAKVRKMPVDKKVVTYADHAVNLAGGLIGLDAALSKYSAQNRKLFEQFSAKGNDSAMILQITGAIDAAKVTIAKQRVKVEKLVKTADDYYQQNLANTGK